MLVAHDKDGTRIFADSGEKYKECFCPVCGEPLTHKVGTRNIPHFAHKPESNCTYGQDKDNKSAWHRHMQELFPSDSIEIRFNDPETGELHIADVFLENSNTVIEFQHSPISEREFLSRTLFHINHGRRVVWIFDESKEGSEFGKFKRGDGCYISDWLHKDYGFEWPRSPRKVLDSLTQKEEHIGRYNNYSVCVYLGNGDIVQRIISQAYGFKEVVFSVHPIELKENMNVDDFFQPEGYWLQESPWKEMIEERKRREAERKAAESAAISRQFFNSLNRQSGRYNGRRRL